MPFTSNSAGLYLKIETIIREPVNSLTHLAGALAGFVGMILMLQTASPFSSKWWSALVYGISVTGLFSASALYHWVKTPERVLRLRKLDHIMIYALIAGTYTPYCVTVFKESTAVWSLVAIWLVAAAGAGIKFFHIPMPRWVSTGLYLLMGWGAVFLVPAAYDSFGIGPVIWIFAGGLSYSIGAIIYATKKPDPFPSVFGFHEIWHLFVLIAAAFHFWGIYRYVMRG